MKEDAELAYKAICEFEKAVYENIFIQDGHIVLEINKDLYLQLENSNEENIDKSYFTPRKYNSYKSLFNDRYKRIFTRNIRAIRPDLIGQEISEKNLMQIINEDKVLKEIYLESIREYDLDNDGTPDRIDIDDNKNYVQTVADLHLVNNSNVDKETERHNRKMEEIKQEKGIERDL